MQSTSFQFRIGVWMLQCFTKEITMNTLERNQRFLEESVELVQSCDMTREQAHHIIDYVFDRPTGEKSQEVGGVMVTLAALCFAHQLDLVECAETEYERINNTETIEKIRKKQAGKPNSIAQNEIKKFTTAELDEIKNKADIVRIVADYVPLTKSEKVYFGTCPFCGSGGYKFSVNPKGFYYCFVCADRGSVFTFVSKMEKITFNQAVNRVALKVQSQNAS